MSRLSRQPTKNHINMHDIIANPLAALPAAIDSISKRPEPLELIEAKSIINELSFLLLRSEEALAVRDTNAFGALMKLLAEGLTYSESVFDEGVQIFNLHRNLLETLHTLFTIIVSWNNELEDHLFKYEVWQEHQLQESKKYEQEEQHQSKGINFNKENVPFPLHSAGVIELIHVISTLCDALVLKEECGKLFMNVLLWLLEIIFSEHVEVNKHTQLQRSIATALINLVKKSRINKQRFLSWRPIARCCVKSVDVFFQLQCVELLFRVSRQRRSVFNEIEGVFDNQHIEQFRTIPNDNTLLEHMLSFVLSLNSERVDVIKHFNLKKVHIADTKLTDATHAFFTEYYFVVMVTNGNADNVTIFYEDIRSVTLTKEGKVLIKLDHFPVKLDLLLNHTAGMDVITLHMSMENLKNFKNSTIRTWILSILEQRKKKVHTATVNEQDKIQNSQKAERDHSQPNKYVAKFEVEQEELHRPQLNRIEYDKEMSNVEAGESTNEVIEIANSALRNDISVDNNEAQISNNQEFKVTNFYKNTIETCLLRQVVEETSFDKKREKENSLLNCKRQSTSSNENVYLTSSKAGNQINSIESNLTQLVSVNDKSNQNIKVVDSNHTSSLTHETCKLIKHMERLQETKVEVRKRAMKDKLERKRYNVLLNIKETETDLYRTYKNWEIIPNQEINLLREKLQEAEELSLFAVTNLNNNLQNIKTSNQALNDRRLCAEVALERFVEENKMSEMKAINLLKTTYTFIKL